MLHTLRAFLVRAILNLKCNSAFRKLIEFWWNDFDPGALRECDLYLQKISACVYTHVNLNTCTHIHTRSASGGEAASPRFNDSPEMFAKCQIDFTSRLQPLNRTRYYAINIERCIPLWRYKNVLKRKMKKMWKKKEKRKRWKKPYYKIANRVGCIYDTENPKVYCIVRKMIDTCRGANLREKERDRASPGGPGDFPGIIITSYKTVDVNRLRSNSKLEK